MCIIFQVLCNDLANGLAGHKAPVRGIQEKIKNGRRSAWVFQSLSLNPRNYRLGKFLGMNNLLPGHIGYPSLWGRNNYFLQLQISALSARTQNEVKIIFIELFNNPTRALVCAELLCKGGCNRQLLSWLICWKSNWLPSHNGVTPRMGHPSLRLASCVAYLHSRMASLAGESASPVPKIARLFFQAFGLLRVKALKTPAARTP